MVVELRHPSAAPAGATLTAQFAVIVQSGSPPPGLADALVSLIRSREAAFVWTELRPPPQPSSLGLLLPTAALIGVAAVGWALWRRMAARRRAR